MRRAAPESGQFIAGTMAGLKPSVCFLSLLCAFTVSPQETPIATVLTSTEAQATTSTSRLMSSTSGLTTTVPALSDTDTSHSNMSTVNNISTTSELPVESSSTRPLTISPNSSFSTLNETTTGLHPISFSTVTLFSNDSDLTSAYVNTNSSLGEKPGTDLARNPGLVAVLCIFFMVLALLLVVVLTKSMSSKNPPFEKLDDVQMNKMNEESPFARYPPK